MTKVAFCCVRRRSFTGSRIGSLVMGASVKRERWCPALRKILRPAGTADKSPRVELGLLRRGTDGVVRAMG
jgi:hypothetical protein